jgi:aspartate/methionine/tyrosine aminotransferase
MDRKLLIASCTNGMLGLPLPFLARKQSIATIPGSAFGPTGEGHLRVSFGCLPDDELEEAMETLAGVEF